MRSKAAAKMMERYGSNKTSSSGSGILQPLLGAAGTAIGAYLGGFISEKVSKKWISIAAGIFFLVMGSILLFEILFNIKFF